MHSFPSRTFFFALVVTAAACDKPPAEPATPAEAEQSTPAEQVAAEAEVESEVNAGDCQNSYNVVGAVSNGDLSESINQQVFTDSNPWKCTIRNPPQTVDFSFNTSATDSSTGCDYALTYVNDTTGNPFSGTQTLSCSADSLDFTTTATPNASNKSCKGLPVITEDPQIQLKRTNC